MKKIYHLLLVVLLLAPIISMPLDIHAQETATTVPVTSELPPIETPSHLSDTTQSSPKNGALALNVFNGMSMSAFASGLASGGTLSSGLLSTAASTVLAPALLGIGLGYSFYQLGASLGVATADLVKTNQSFYESASTDSKAQEELTKFALSGIDSTTNTYDFSSALQTRYSQDVTSHALMREYLTGTDDHGVFDFTTNNDSTIYRKYINYTHLYSDKDKVGVIGRDSSFANLEYASNQFFILESIRILETERGTDIPLLTISGAAYLENGNPQSFLYQKELDVSMTTLVEQLSTPEKLLDYVQNTTTFTLGSIDIPSKEEAIKTVRQMAKEYLTRTTQISDSLAEVLAPENNQLKFDPSGMLASLYGNAVVLDKTGKFIYAHNEEAVPTHLLGAIEFSYSEEAIPNDDSLTIDGKRGVLDEETGDIVEDGTKETLIKGAMGTAWNALSLKRLLAKIKELTGITEEELKEIEWYTPIDLYYDEHHAEGGRGHTIARHIGKTEAEIKERLNNTSLLKHSSTFDDPVHALIFINAAIFTANQTYLDGPIKLSLGDCHLKTNNNRVIYKSLGSLTQGLSIGWGFYKIKKDNFLRYDTIYYTTVIIQRTKSVIRKKRKYYILTAYPDLKRMMEMTPQSAGSYTLLSNRANINHCKSLAFGIVNTP